MEAARQIRMRGVGGMILIDFIDMDREDQKEEILSLLRRETARDRVKTVVLGMTALGLVEMTRKRTAHRLFQNYYEPCRVCRGQICAVCLLCRSSDSSQAGGGKKPGRDAVSDSD